LGLLRSPTRGKPAHHKNRPAHHKKANLLTTKNRSAHHKKTNLLTTKNRPAHHKKANLLTTKTGLFTTKKDLLTRGSAHHNNCCRHKQAHRPWEILFEGEPHGLSEALLAELG